MTDVHSEVAHAPAPLPKRPHALTGLEIAAIVAIIVVWGVNNAGAKLATQELSPLLVGAIRFGIATACLIAFVRPPFPDWKSLMLIVVIGSILLTRNLKVDHISKRQAVLEMAYLAGTNFFEGLLGEKGRRYVPYLMTVAIYIAFSNLIGVFGVKPPTKDLDVTAALALMSIVLIEGAGIRARGGVGFLKSLSAPTPVMTPMNILEIAIRPTSLCMRLFGNVLGAFVIMELIKLVVPVFVPAVFSLYFDLFDGLIQTYVFVFLTSLFMKETMGGED